MFFGEFSHTMDAKGRVSLPAKHRSAFESGVQLVRGLDKSLWIFTTEQYTTFLESLDNSNPMESRARALRLFFYSSAVEVEIDQLGRIRVPPKWREYAGLSKNVTFVGNGDHIEIWDTDAFGEFMDGVDVQGEIDSLVADGRL